VNPAGLEARKPSFYGGYARVKLMSNA
jgi:hypothetical protein